jgi:ABC-type uncharacterized transport system fused permease/ATPase subunit
VFRSVAALPQNLSTLSPVAGECHRLAELLERLDAEAMTAAKRGPPTITMSSPAGLAGGSPLLALSEVTIFTPKKENFDRKVSSTCLISDLSLQLHAKETIVVRGSNASGKSALLRAISGLWQRSVDGRVDVPTHRGRGGLFCVPQAAYAVAGSLLEQVIYPDTLQLSGDVALNNPPITKITLTPDLERRVQACLVAVRLAHVEARFGLHSTQAWNDLLSGGEKQRLGVARVLYHRPAVAVMDECTSALDGITEKACLRALTDTGAAFLHIGNRPALVELAKETIELTVNKDGAFTRSARTTSLDTTAAVPASNHHSVRDHSSSENFSHALIAEAHKRAANATQADQKNIDRLTWNTRIRHAIFFFSRYCI